MEAEVKENKNDGENRPSRILVGNLINLVLLEGLRMSQCFEAVVRVVVMGRQVVKKRVNYLAVEVIHLLVRPVVVVNVVDKLAVNQDLYWGSEWINRANHLRHVIIFIHVAIK